MNLISGGNIQQIPIKLIDVRELAKVCNQIGNENKICNFGVNIKLLKHAGADTDDGDSGLDDNQGAGSGGDDNDEEELLQRPQDVGPPPDAQEGE